jgi:hypothetical protein
MPLWRITSRPLGRRLAWLGILTTVSLITTGAVGIATPAQAAPPYTLDERAAAIASPSLVYLETVYTGYLRDKTTDVPLLASPVTYNRRCSGFVVNPDGYVVTTRVCVQPPQETIRQQVLYAAGSILVKDGKLAAADLAKFVTTNMNTATFTGQTENSAPQIALVGQLNVANASRVDPPAIPGHVLAAAPPDQGNVAIVKLDQRNLPAVELHPASLEPGSSVVTLGFDTSDPDARTGTYTPHPKTARVLGEGHRGQALFYRIDEKLGNYEHGGMAVDGDGRVVGMIDEDPALPNNQNRAITQLSSITPLLTQAKVGNTLSANDRRYRSGLDAYFKGQYSTAIQLLDETTSSVPANHVAKTYRQLAADRQRIEGEPASRPNWWIPVLAAVGGAVLAAIILLLVFARRLRSRREPVVDRFVALPTTEFPAQTTEFPAPGPDHSTYQPPEQRLPWYQEVPPDSGTEEPTAPVSGGAPSYQPPPPSYQPSAPSYEQPPPSYEQPPPSYEPPPPNYPPQPQPEQTPPDSAPTVVLPWTAHTPQPSSESPPMLWPPDNLSGSPWAAPPPNTRPANPDERQPPSE